METIGGHFPAIVGTRSNPLPGEYAYESARSCLYSFLRAYPVKRMYVPNYICEAVPDVILKSGAEVVKYPINQDFILEGPLDVSAGEFILIANYFGLNEGAVLQQVRSFSTSSVIVDCAQAYFQKPTSCLASIYSPRKFIPVPDGGVVHTAYRLESEPANDGATIERYKYLISRVNTEPELSRGQYLSAEQGLASPSLRTMSAFTRKLIETCDLDFISARRRKNFTVLEALSGINMLNLRMGGQVPLCYPLMIKGGAVLREKLKEKRIFTPVYWPDVVPMNSFEKQLLESTVYLPLDHRYGEDHMQYVVDTVMSML